MKKKKIIKALQNHCRLMAKDFDERMQKLQKENETLFAQIQIYRSNCSHYSNKTNGREKIKEVTIK